MQQGKIYFLFLLIISLAYNKADSEMLDDSEPDDDPTVWDLASGDTDESCKSDGVCNFPFGWCASEDVSYKCECMTVVSGEHCTNVLLFIFLVLLSIMMFFAFVAFMWYSLQKRVLPENLKEVGLGKAVEEQTFKKVLLVSQDNSTNSSSPQKDVEIGEKKLTEF